MNRLLLISLASVLLCASAFASDAEQALKKIWHMYDQETRAAIAANRSYDPVPLRRKAREIAREALKSLDESRANVADLAAWGQIAAYADEPQLGVRLYRRYVQEAPDGASLLEPNMMLIALSVETDDIKSLETALESFRPASLRDTEQYLSYLSNQVVEFLLDKGQFKLAVNAVDRAERFFLADVTVAQKQHPLESFRFDPQLSRGRADIAATKARILNSDGRPKEARALLESEAKNDSLQPLDRSRLEGLVKQHDLIGVSAPELEPTERLGEIKNLDQFRGKTVILYFFSNMSRQVSVDLDRLGEMAKEIGDDRVQIVAVYQPTQFSVQMTESAKKTMEARSRSVPFLLMAEGGSDDYGISGFRTIAVIDSSGKVRGFFSQQPMATERISRLVGSLAK